MAHLRCLHPLSIHLRFHLSLSLLSVHRRGASTWLEDAAHRLLCQLRLSLLLARLHSGGIEVIELHSLDGADVKGRVLRGHDFESETRQAMNDNVGAKLHDTLQRCNHPAPRAALVGEISEKTGCSDSEYGGSMTESCQNVEPTPGPSTPSSP